MFVRVNCLAVLAVSMAVPAMCQADEGDGLAPSEMCDRIGVAIEISGLTREHVWALRRNVCEGGGSIVAEHLNEDLGDWLRADAEVCLWEASENEGALLDGYTFGGRGASYGNVGPFQDVLLDLVSGGSGSQVQSLSSFVERSREGLESPRKELGPARLAGAALERSSSLDGARESVVNLVAHLVSTGEIPWGAGPESVQLIQSSGGRRQSVISGHRAPAYALSEVLRRWGAPSASTLVERARERGWESDWGGVAFAALVSVRPFGVAWLGLVTSEDVEGDGIDPSGFVVELGRAAGLEGHTSPYDAFRLRPSVSLGVAESGVLHDYVVGEVIVVVREFGLGTLSLEALDVIGRLGIESAGLRAACLPELEGLASAGTDQIRGGRALFWFARWGGDLSLVKGHYDALIEGIRDRELDAQEFWLPCFSQLDQERASVLIALAREGAVSLSQVVYAFGRSGVLDARLGGDLFGEAVEVLSRGGWWDWATAYRLGLVGPIEFSESDSVEIAAYKAGARILWFGAEELCVEELGFLLKLLDGYAPLAGFDGSGEAAYAAGRILADSAAGRAAVAGWLGDLIGERGVGEHEAEFLAFLAEQPGYFDGELLRRFAGTTSWQRVPLSLLRRAAEQGVYEWSGAARLRVEAGEVAALAVCGSLGGFSPRDLRNADALLRGGDASQRLECLSALESLDLEFSGALLRILEEVASGAGPCALVASKMLG